MLKQGLSTDTVRELVGRVHNVILMNVYLDLGNPGGSGNLEGGGFGERVGKGEVSLHAT